MDSTDSVGGISQVIPQLTYDLIARIIPGVLLLGIASAVWSREIARWAAVGNPSLVDVWTLRNLPAIVLVAYFLVQMLESVWYGFIDNRLTKRYREMEDEVAAACLSALRSANLIFDSKRYIFPGLPLIYDAVRLKNPVAGSRIVKIRAEMQMYRNSSVGVLLILLIHLVASIITLSLHGQNLAVAGVLALGVMCLYPQAMFRRRRLVWALYNHWLVLFETRLTVSGQRLNVK